MVAMKRGFYPPKLLPPSTTTTLSFGSVTIIPPCEQELCKNPPTADEETHIRTKKAALFELRFGSMAEWWCWLEEEEEEGEQKEMVYFYAVTIYGRGKTQ